MSDLFKKEAERIGIEIKVHTNGIMHHLTNLIKYNKYFSDERCRSLAHAAQNMAEFHLDSIKKYETDGYKTKLAIAITEITKNCSILDDIKDNLPKDIYEKIVKLCEIMHDITTALRDKKNNGEFHA